MKIDSGVLSVSGQTITLPLVHADALVRVWSVPPEYRENGLFVAVVLPGQPGEIPACSMAETEYLGELEYKAAEAHKLEAAKVAKLAQLNAGCELELMALTNTYPSGELQSWPQQVQEATALLLDPKASTPLLSAIADARGLTVKDLAERVQSKAAGYATYSGAIIGKRQAAEDLLDKANSLEEVEAVAW
ncbi:hypothetical protein [Pseudomonas sp. NPDC089734]|uniref:hypothetical protein n=1 Tax=Pseudomonas sp. NPDC089734 TaxID=3364469 RepID=UPI0037FFB4CF